MMSKKGILQDPSIFFLVTLVLFVSQNLGLSQKMQIDDEEMGQDFVYCIERGGCGLSSICSFSFNGLHVAESNSEVITSKHPSSPKDSIENEATKSLEEGEEESECKDELCKPLVFGHIFSISNDMDYNITFKWDVLDRPHKKNNGNTHVVSNRPIQGEIKVESRSVTYFTTDIKGTHVVRLSLGTQFIDKVVALEQKMCKHRDACDFLFRSCYYLGRDDPMCKTYESQCSGFTKKKQDREQCIETCLITYFPHLMKEKTAETTDDISSKTATTKRPHTWSADPSNVLECLVESDNYKKFKNENPISAAWHLSPSSTPIHSDSIWVLWGILIFLGIVFLGLTFYCWCFGHPFCYTLTPCCFRKGLYTRSSLSRADSRAADEDVTPSTKITTQQQEYYSSRVLF
jgi:hypothetical protein